LKKNSAFVKITGSEELILKTALEMIKKYLAS